MKRQLSIALAAAAGAAAAVWLYRRRARSGQALGVQVQATAVGGARTAAGADSPGPKPAKAEADAKAAAEAEVDAKGAAEAAAAAAEQRRMQQEQRQAEQLRRALPLYRITQNEKIVHEMLVGGQEGGLAFLEPGEPGAGVPAHLASGRRAPPGSAAPAAEVGPPPSEEAAAAAETRQAVVAAVERAFFDALAEALRRGNAASLASLLLDSRDQLAALLPQHPPGGASGGGEARQLQEELREKLDAGYVMQRLQRWDAAYAASCFDLLVHIIGRLQAPARRPVTRAAYADVAALFAAAAAAEAEGAASPAAPAASQTATDSNDRVQLRLSYGADDAVAVQLARAAPASPATPEALAAEPARAASSAGPELDLEWQLRLVPAPDGEGMVAVLVPVEAAAAIASSAGGEAGTEQAASSSPGDVSSSSGGGISEASVEAVVEAARFMHHQLNELKADVANAHLAMLKEAILGDGSAVEYERHRYLRALQPPSSTGSAGSGSGAAESMVALSEAFPITLAWLRQVLLEAPPPPRLQGPAFTQAAVESGVLLLLQRPRAVSPADCPETLLLDLEALVILQNELQRLCLVAASLLIVQQILAAQRALPPAGSPRHEALCERVVQRMGVLLSSGANLEALVLELHQQLEAELAAGAAEGAAGAELAAAVGEAASKGTAAAAAASPAGVELSVVRRMAERIFSTSDTVYQRVQAGFVAAATALLRSASSGDSPDSGSPDTWRKILKGISAAGLASDVRRLAAALHRIATVSAAVAGPVVYAPLLAQLQQEQPERQRRRH